MTEVATPRIVIGLRTQSLILIDASGERRSYTVSTARLGPGEQRDSEQTPRGRHLIRAKIGAGLPAGAVLVGRRP
ncbi:MAG: L,D-transpeptidase, partial [Gammaproteobacteria bacterium]